MSTHAACSARPTRSVPTASMVVTLLPLTAEIGVWQARTTCPSTCTVQAPHSAMPQPYLVPVSPSSSRRAHSSGVSSGRLTLYRRPFTVTEVIAILLSSVRQALSRVPSVTGRIPRAPRGVNVEGTSRLWRSAPPAAYPWHPVSDYDVIVVGAGNA